ncbi:MAG: hypothetical protein KDB80_10110 [Planctomycetes bacterium]|nr:hypothetical protein [Planctomycetota bacterium]
MTRPTIVMLIGVLLGGCGYTFGVDEFGAGVRTVAIEIVENRTFWQGYEVPLTRALHRSLARHTDLRPTSSTRADATLRVAVASIEGRALVRGGVAPLREGAVDVTIEAELVDASGHVLRQRTVLDRAEFRIPVGESDDSARLEAVSDLARKIVLALEGEF